LDVTAGTVRGKELGVRGGDATANCRLDVTATAEAVRREVEGVRRGNCMGEKTGTASAKLRVGGA